MPAITSIEQQLTEILGTQNLRPANPADSLCGLTPKFVAEPATEQQLAAVLAFANQAALSVIPRGGATKLAWGNPPQSADLILSTARLNKILEHAWADLTVTVEAGCTIQSLQETLALHGQRLAFDALWPAQATIGGALSTNDSGALRLRFGALRDLIIGVTLALPDGTLASSGGKVVKNVAGYDLPKLATGALGTLGVITRAVFRLHPLPWATKTFSFPAQSPGEMQAHILAIHNSTLAHSALQFRASSSAPQLTADILFEATDAGLAAQEAHLRAILNVTTLTEAPQSIWTSREQLWSNSAHSLIAKFTFLPNELAAILQTIQSTATRASLHYQLVAQATGIATVRLDGPPNVLRTAVQEFRHERELHSASFVLQRRPNELSSLDAWGNLGDALPLMQAIKHQLDPKHTLNPRRLLSTL